LPNHLLDTSALAKRYHKENGSEYIERILEQPVSRSLISHITVVELESVIAIKTRTGEIDEQASQLVRRQFRADIARHRLLVSPPVHQRNFHTARRLLIRYGATEGLRTLDALQLAIFLDLRDQGRADVFVTADQRLCRVASIAGCSAVNPEQPGQLLV
jgi:predicted nucleic acid-binding protein